MTAHDPIHIGAEDAARVLGIGRTLFYSLQSGGRLPAPVKLGRRALWRVDELRRWSDAGCPSRHEWERIRDQA